MFVLEKNPEYGLAQLPHLKDKISSDMGKRQAQDHRVNVMY